ncbi:MAG: hypothetical protein QXG01_03175 [Candidatus Bathyarchaeia archaeon]
MRENIKTLATKFNFERKEHSNRRKNLSIEEKTKAEKSLFFSSRNRYTKTEGVTQLHNYVITHFGFPISRKSPARREHAKKEKLKFLRNFCVSFLIGLISLYAYASGEFLE